MDYITFFILQFVKIGLRPDLPEARRDFTSSEPKITSSLIWQAMKEDRPTRKENRMESKEAKMEILVKASNRKI
jgi:hypothetical protein